MIKNKTIHTKTIISIAMLLSVIPLTSLVLILFYYTLRQNNQREQNIIKNAEAAIEKSITSEISAIEKAADLCSHQMDFLVFCNSSDRKKLYQRGADITKSLKEKCTTLPSVSAIFLYNTSCDYTYPCYFYNAPTSLRKYAQKPVSQNNMDSKGWMTVNIDDEPFLYYQIQSRYGIMTVFLNPNKNYDYKHSLQSDSLNIQILDYSQLDTQAFDQLILTEIPQTSLFITCDALNNHLMRNIDLFQIIMMILIITFILFIPLLWYFVQRILLTPISQLDELFCKIRNNHADSRVPVDSQIAELRSFAENFNEMLDNIDRLNKEVYEQKLDVTRARLQFLQLQIRPHFYLNCLKNMYSQLNMKQYDKIGAMILALSSYFAQAFHDVQNFILLRNELNACQSYIQLQNILDRQITLDVDTDSRCVNALCLPMTIVTFVENCIKHSSNQCNLTICIKTELIHDADQTDALIITIKNNGTFSKDALNALNSADPSEMIYKHEKIGIANVRYRLWLIYKEKSSITFFNKDNQAVVELKMPFEQV